VQIYKSDPDHGGILEFGAWLVAGAAGDHSTYGISLIVDADFTRRIRVATAAVLNIEQV
jgi:hypothetical protein